MRTSADHGWCADTSVAVAALNEAHEASRIAALRHRPAFAGHAAFEKYSVLTRLPGTALVSAQVARSAISSACPERCWLSRTQHERLLARVSTLGIEGGMVYDALVAEAARVSNRTLLTRDERSRRVYELLAAPFEFVD